MTDTLDLSELTRALAAVADEVRARIVRLQDCVAPDQAQAFCEACRAWVASGEALLPVPRAPDAPGASLPASDFRKHPMCLVRTHTDGTRVASFLFLRDDEAFEDALLRSRFDVHEFYEFQITAMQSTISPRHQSFIPNESMSCQQAVP